MSIAKTAFAAATVMSAAAASNAAMTYIGSHNGSDYFTTDNKVNIPSARASALTMARDGAGASLVTINSADEQAWLNERLGFSTRFWIGITDEIVEGEFAWENGEPVTFTNWAPNEPNDWGSGEDFAVMSWKNNGQWNDLKSSSNNRAIIEITPIPTPGAASLAAGAVLIATRRRR